VAGEDLDDPRCPECGGPVGPTATYCMHCSADLADSGPVAPEELSSGTGDAETGATGTAGETGAGGEGSDPMNVSTATSTPAEHPIDPDGVMDNTLTVIVGILGGLVIGVLGSFVLLVLFESGWSVLLGLAAWLGATAYLVRRRFVLDAVSKGAYGVALVLLSLPLIALRFNEGLVENVAILVLLLFFALFPAGIAAGIGWFASRYVPENAGGGR